jgi:hypothetical protein
LRNQQLLSYTRNSQHFIEAEGSLQYSQEPAIGPYPEPDGSSPHLSSCFSNIHFNTILPSKNMVFFGLIPSGFSLKTLYALPHICATFPAHLILPGLIIVTLAKL